MMKPYDFCLKLICFLFIVRKVDVNMENIHFIITSGLGHSVKLIMGQFLHSAVI